MARPKAFDPDAALLKAVDLFWEKGFEATSIQDLETRLGIGRKSIYDTFGDKRQLYLKSLEAYRIQGLEYFDLLKGSDSIQEKLQTFFQKIIDGCLADPDNRGCFMGNATLEFGTTDQEVSNLVCLNLEGFETAFLDALSEAQKKGEIRTEKDLHELAEYLFSSIQGIRVTAKATRDRSKLEAIAALTLSILN